MKYRILKVVKRGEAKYFPQKRCSFLFIKYWGYFINEFGDYDVSFSQECRAKEFLENLDQLKVNYKEVIKFLTLIMFATIISCKPASVKVSEQSKEIGELKREAEMKRFTDSLHEATRAQADLIIKYFMMTNEFSAKGQMGSAKKYRDLVQKIGKQ